MPSTLTYPGVYIEEVPSGVRTISGVATSVAAFVGWAPRGTTARAQLILSWADYERHFGGLDPRSPLGYAVSHFYANGGQQAYVVRLAHSDAQTASAALDGLTIDASGPGRWANDYKITTRRAAGNPTRFRLSVVYDKDGANAVVESFENLSLNAADPRSVASVIAEGSTLITARVTNAAQTPADQTQPLAGGADGTVLEPNDANFHAALAGDGDTTGLYRLKRVDLFNLLVIPGETDPATLKTAQAFCRTRRAFLIADAAGDATLTSLQNGPNTDLTGNDAINAAFYFPWVKAPDPNLEGRLRVFPPSGFVAGIYARTDATRGIWKAPAGTDASLTGASGVSVPLTDLENGVLNVQAVNCIRNLPVYGTVAWGARTLHGNNERGSEWKYIPVRRTALFIEESLDRGLKWVVFEPNDEPLWAQIRLNVGAFMQDLFRQGAFQGRTPREAYFVKCDRETTTQTDINNGIVNILVGFAPLKPAEFVVIRIQQMAGQIAT